jgi:SAM-dependent methyltransferase
MLKKLVKGAIRLTTLGCETGHHMNRYRMYHDIEKTLAEVDKTGLGGDIVAISGSGDLSRLLKHPAPKITHAVYPQETLLGLSYPDNSFDYVMNDQVLEHVAGDPQKAVDETFRVLKPGGISVLTTCLLQELHGLPNDYWRFTPNGLKYLFRNYSQIISASSWGNRLAFFAFRYFPVPHAKWHPLHKIAMRNEPEAPMLTWIIARK